MRLSPPLAIAACTGCAAFAVAIFAGLAAGNDGIAVLTRAIVAMAAAWAIGLVAGLVGTQVLREEVDRARAKAGSGADDGDTVDVLDLEPADEREEPIEV